MIALGSSSFDALTVADPLARPSVRIEEYALVEDYLGAYLDDEAFASRYPLAHERWSQTWETLWQANSRAAVLAVAQLARETMWEFACTLVRLHASHAPAPMPSETALRLWAVVEMYRPELGDDRCGLLETLFDYWQALCSSVERHEQGAPRVAERLHWEDGRRAALLTALVMVEVDRSI